MFDFAKIDPKKSSAEYDFVGLPFPCTSVNEGANPNYYFQRLLEKNKAS